MDRQFTSTLEFDLVARALERFSLKRFSMPPLHSTEFSLTFEPLVYRPYDSDDDHYNNPYNDDDEWGLRSQDVGIQYGKQQVGRFAVIEEEKKGTVVKVFTSEEMDVPPECRDFLLDWFAAFEQEFSQPLVPAATSAGGSVVHEQELAGDVQDGNEAAVLPSDDSADYRTIIDALWRGYVELPAGPSVKPYIEYYYLQNLLEIAQNIPAGRRTTWRRVAAMYEQKNPTEASSKASDPYRNMGEKWKQKFDDQHPVFKETYERLCALERSKKAK